MQDEPPSDFGWQASQRALSPPAKRALLLANLQENMHDLGNLQPLIPTTQRTLPCKEGYTTENEQQQAAEFGVVCACLL